MKILCVSSFIFLLLLNTFPQNPPKPTQSNQPKQCNAVIARQMVEQQAIESKKISDSGKRINVLIKVADYLWTLDEPTARGYFLEAFEIARKNAQQKPELSSINSTMFIEQKTDYRFLVIRAIARRDAELAKKLTETALKEIEENKEKESGNNFDNDLEENEIHAIAGSLIEFNPGASLYFFRRAMKFPLSQNWYFSLYKIAAKDDIFAQQVYEEVLINYQNENVSSLLYLSAFPFGNERIWGPLKLTVSIGIPSNPLKNRTSQRSFLRVLLNKIAVASPETAANPMFGNIPETVFSLSALNEIEPLINSQHSELQQLFLQARNALAAQITPEITKQLNETAERAAANSSSFAERIAKLEEAEEKGLLKDRNIVFLIMSAKTDEEYAQIPSWLDKLTDENVKTNAYEFYYFQRSKLAIKENRFEDARKYADKIGKIENRAVIYFDIAENKLKNTETKFQSYEPLLEAYKIAEKAPDSIEKAQVFLGLAYWYSKFDRFNGLDALSNAVKTANKLENPNLFTSNIRQQIVGKDFGLFVSYQVPGFDINRTFYEMSAENFQTATGQAEAFSDQYLRTLAILATVKDCEKTAKPATKKSAVKN